MKGLVQQDKVLLEKMFGEYSFKLTEKFRYKTNTGMMCYFFISLLKKSKEYLTYLGFRNLRKVHRNIYTNPAQRFWET